ncbi:lipase family protein [Williamsia sp. CHRR-6]|uniref:lipase family protein n=1 Tax=Williamsia sp. CHRR-6 TaxID=2835871 RepID=UPI001BDAD6C7|nr:lipase family protein [Williamsia sp. CHRR-6]MBT0565925.1 alpha/beta hydrolase [Williamsia sp. CHRR-6]
MVWVPVGKPPANGWPVVAYGHGNTGSAPGCGPSQFPDLLNYGDAISEFVRNGYALVITDYEGLGGPGVFGVFDAQTFGLNMIDSVRAATKVSPLVSSQWAAIGASQGGAAAWAANELASTYGAGLNFVGSVALAPTLDMSSLVDRAAQKTLTDPQRDLYVQQLLSFRRGAHPDIVLTDYMPSDVVANGAKITACKGPAVAQAAALLDRTSRSAWVPASRQAADRVRAWLSDYALPTRVTSGPVQVTVPTDDPLSPESAMNAAITESCKLGSEIEIIRRTGRAENGAEEESAFAWIRNRFAGVKPSDNDCRTQP